MCGSRFTTCGEFRLNPNPVEIDEWGFWEIATEDGVTFIAVPVHLYAASPDTSKIAHEKGDEIWPCIDRAYHIPKNVADYDRRRVLLASKAVVLACDGAYWHHEREWGVRGVFRHIRKGVVTRRKPKKEVQIELSGRPC